MKRLVIIVVGIVLASLAGAKTAEAASCWRVTGWSSTNWVGAQALVTPADCTTIPLTQGWAHVDLSYGTPPTDDLWLSINLSDSRVSGWKLTPLLLFSHYDLSGKPVVQTDALLCGCPNETPLLAYPPVQGVPTVGSKVRLRHRNSNKCVYSVPSNGQSARNATCTNDADMTFVLDNAGSSTLRLRNEPANQCLYALGNGQPLFNWGCWADPGMRYQFDAADGGYRVRNVSTSQCAYGTTTEDGIVRTWGCWADPAMVYWVDIISRSPTVPHEPWPELPSEK